MKAVPELMFIMLPSPCARITGITACIAQILSVVYSGGDGGSRTNHYVDST